MREKNEKLKIYEFLYNRLPFNDDETKEYQALCRSEALEEEFEQYLQAINMTNIDICWHSEVFVDGEREFVHVLLITDYCYYIFILQDLEGEHYINPFNILCTDSHEAVMDLNRSDKLYQMFKAQLIDEGEFQRPIIVKYIMMNDRFRIKSRKSDLFLSKENLPYYLKAIEHSAVIKNKDTPMPG
ncbi:hypothetical protein [Salinicoccus sp. YB14-2]|uniref:hypothetical protein n=1 Tax=Salinicoccus sp. YB14-2 TaxID=1572701 RepID=UPI00068BAD71|nr:hypothetical protein [Salinicoccus sp. YB14-2]